MGSAAWREWSEDASPELFAFFNARADEEMYVVRRQFPPDCGPRHPQYFDLKRQTVEALDLLAQCLLEEHENA
jgi:hypothetical protein